MNSLTVSTKRIFFFLLAVMTWLLATGQTPPGARIDPRVLEDTAGGQTARFLVVFERQLAASQSSAPGGRSNAQVLQMIDNLKSAANADQAPVRAYLDRENVEYKSYWVANVIAVRGNRTVVENLAVIPEVALIEPDRDFLVDLETIGSTDKSDINAPNIPAMEPNLVQVHAPQVWALGKTGSGSVYAVADTGVYWQHPALINQYRGWNGTDASHDYNWWDAIHGDIDGGSNTCGYSSPTPCDDYGHGTHVLGIGIGDDGTGYQIGMAPDARWIACRNMDSGVGRPSTYIECFQFFIAPTRLDGSDPRPDLRPDVISNSYACPPSEECNVDSLDIALLAIREAGIFMAVSAGNYGPSCETVRYPPGISPLVFSIGAVNNVNAIAGFSSRGPVTGLGEGYIKPNLVAPGVSIYSSDYHGGYVTMSGTSMAAPHVAGAVAILWGAFPSLKRNVVATEALLADTALPLYDSDDLLYCGSDNPYSHPNNVYGWGLLDLQKAYWTVYWSFQPRYIFPLVFKN